MPKATKYRPYRVETACLIRPIHPQTDSDGVSKAKSLLNRLNGLAPPIGYARCQFALPELTAGPAPVGLYSYNVVLHDMYIVM